MRDLWHHYAVSIGPVDGPTTILGRFPTEAQARTARQTLLTRARGHLEIAAATRVQRVRGVHRQTVLLGVGWLVLLTPIVALAVPSPWPAVAMLVLIACGLLWSRFLPAARLWIPTVLDDPEDTLDV